MTNADFAEILNGFADPAFILGNDRKVVAANTTAHRIFGHVISGVDFVRIMRQPEILHLIDQCRNGEARVEDVLTLDSSLRGVFRVQVTRLSSGGVVLSFTDLSDIQIATKMRSDFVANVSHELRSPLTALSGFIETLQGPARDDQNAQQRFLELMAMEAGRMDRLIADLMSLSKVEIDARVRPRDKVDTISVIKRVLATLGPAMEKSNVDIQVILPTTPVMVTGDGDQLTQVFRNLIENAVKYGGEKQTVMVTAKTLTSAPGMASQTLSVAIRDKGPGIAPEHLPRLTERFYRVDTGRSRDKGGTGLGLAIVKHIVQRHRGRLLIDSVLGEGSTFTVLLPAQT